MIGMQNEASHPATQPATELEGKKRYKEVGKDKTTKAKADGKI